VGVCCLLFFIFEGFLTEVFRSSFFSQVFLSQGFSLNVGVGKIYLRHDRRQVILVIEVFDRS